MTAHRKGRDATGAVDKDRRSRRRKMDRELPETDARGINDRDVRGRGRQMNEQQRREPDFDRVTERDS